MDTFKVPGHTFMVPKRMDVTKQGAPELVLGGSGGIGPRVYGAVWSDTTWATTWSLPYGTAFSWPVNETKEQRHLIWKTLAPNPDVNLTELVMARVQADTICCVDTVAQMWVDRFSYSAAASPKRRWVVAADRVHGPDYGPDLRIFWSDSLRSWQEVPVDGDGYDGVDVTVLDDTTALVVYDGFPLEGLKWGVLRGASWTPGVKSPPHHVLHAGPRLRPRPSGGQWLVWSAKDSFVLASTFRDGAWSEPESIRCNFTRAGQHLSNILEISRDTGEYPAIAWMDYNTHGGITTMCISFPTDSGFGVADEIPNSVGGGPTIARDGNGDVWMAWWTYFEGMFWIHSYTTATSSVPRVTGRGRHRQVAWTLSEPAPETWWAVERSRDGEAYETATRVRAGHSLEMAWLDDSPPRGHLSYRIRRECRDTRYQWVSEATEWPDHGRGRRVIKVTTAPRLGSVQEVEVEGAAPGVLRIKLYDLQGRLVFERERRVSGFTREAVALDIGKVGTSGIWFLRVTDSAGNQSPSIKVVTLK